MFLTVVENVIVSPVEKLDFLLPAEDVKLFTEKLVYDNP
jgi:hypothetical protein